MEEKRSNLAIADAWDLTFGLVEGDVEESLMTFFLKMCRYKMQGGGIHNFSSFQEPTRAKIRRFCLAINLR